MTKKKKEKNYLGIYMTDPDKKDHDKILEEKAKVAKMCVEILEQGLGTKFKKKESHEIYFESFVTLLLNEGFIFVNHKDKIIRDFTGVYDLDGWEALRLTDPDSDNRKKFQSWIEKGLPNFVKNAQQEYELTGEIKAD